MKPFRGAPVSHLGKISILLALSMCVASGMAGGWLVLRLQSEGPLPYLYLAQGDTDVDGVADGIDKCPHTPREAVVDQYGCTEILLPSFPTRLPNPSNRAVYGLSDIGEWSGQSLGDLVTGLERSLKAAGYQRVQYYRTATGVALVTRIERLYSNGSPLPLPSRWSLDNHSEAQITGFWQELRKLNEVEPGYYRMLVFLLTHRGEHFEFTAPNQPLDLVISMSDASSTLGPVSLSGVTMTRNYRLHVWLYEFLRPTETHNIQYANMGHSVAVHLAQSGVAMPPY